MLDILRKNARSWLIKLTLGAIIISFAFFFGYNRMTRAKKSIKGLAPGQAVATVNGVEISDTEFSFFFDRNMERLKGAFKGEGMAETIHKFAQNMTLQQMIQRQLLLQTSRSLGIRVTDAELAATIRKNPELIRDGEFDPIFYRHQYLPYFENRFGINYEELLRQDLTINALERLFAGTESKAPEQNESALWTFEVASKAVKDEAEEKAFLDSLAKNRSAFKTVGPIPIEERAKILNGRGTFEDFEKIFALNAAHPVLDKPVKIGDEVFVVRFVGRKTSPVKATQEKQTEFLDSWIREQAKTANIVTYLQ